MTRHGLSSKLDKSGWGLLCCDRTSTARYSNMSYPSALENDPKVIVFSDFDGTITIDDSL